MIIRRMNVYLAILMALLAFIAQASEEDVAVRDVKISEQDINNLRQPKRGFLVGGQPDTKDLDALAKAGVRYVINMRPQAEHPGFDEAAEVAKRGMSYYALPIASADDLTLTKVRTLDAMLRKAGEGGVFLHCASGNRVGAMMALRAGLIHGKDTEDAIATGKAWGMTRLEPAVRRLLGDL